MKRFIYAKPPCSACTIAYTGYYNRINVDRIIFIYISQDHNGDVYNIVLDFGRRTETWQVSEKTYHELEEMTYGR